MLLIIDSNQPSLKQIK